MKKPPISVQILYALGIVGLIIGILGAVLKVFSSFNGGVSPVSGILLGIVVIVAFILINFIRKGVLWALITYSIIFAIDTVVIITKLIQQGNTKHGGLANLVSIALGITLLAVIWLKDKNYFKDRPADNDSPTMNPTTATTSQQSVQPIAPSTNQQSLNPTEVSIKQQNQSVPPVTPIPPASQQ